MENIEKAAKKYSGLGEIIELDNKKLYTRIDINDSYITGAFSDEAKMFHQKGLYTEEEIKLLLESFKVVLAFAQTFGLPCDIMELFEQNKKKL